jgi:Ni,Fe-hydrogenase III small subunit/NAD-dependent dihydropyrimidine dehydrogenase PreA subunit
VTFAGRPRLDSEKCVPDCHKCASLCPAGAIEAKNGKISLDLGRCIFCRQCEKACSAGAIKFSQEYCMAVDSAQKLIIKDNEFELAERMGDDLLKMFGRSFNLRQVSAGGCNACEADTNVLNTPLFDLSRFGIRFVASPRHADGLLITGPVTQNMLLALQKTYDAVPEPKIVIAVGACAISGGLFRDNAEVSNGAANLFKVDLFVPGCPPSPWTILDGLLRLLDRR